MADVMTVVEFATKHCREHGEADQLRDMVQAHVDTMVMGALATGHSLWKVGVDAEGRVSLIWASMPEDIWERLLAESLAVASVARLLGGLR